MSSDACLEQRSVMQQDPARPLLQRLMVTAWADSSPSSSTTSLTA